VPVVDEDEDVLLETEVLDPETEEVELPLVTPVKQALLAEVCTVKGADWTVSPEESRNVKSMLVPPVILTAGQEYEVPVKPLKDRRAGPVGSAPG